MKRTVRLSVNGGEHSVSMRDPQLSLLDYLRGELGLTAAKRGCGEGHCGTCTVLIDGQAELACLKKLGELEGARVLTLESLSGPESLHPLQYAFATEGAIQCGFCTPGMILAAKALLDANPEPADREIARALSRNLCRCTGYVKILQAVRKASGYLRSGRTEFRREEVYPAGAAELGRPVVRTDAVAKATGELKFSDDLNFPNTLHAAVLRSEHPHAEILGIDVSAAERLPGVAAVLTARDVPGRNAFGLLLADQPVFAVAKVRYMGDALAAVYAEDEHTAREALQRIKVRYRPLPVLSTPMEALAPDAPLVHERAAQRVGEEGHPAEAQALPGAPPEEARAAGQMPRNVFSRMHSGRGDVEKGFAEADEILEDDYTTPFIEHAYLEPESGTAVPEPDGGISIYVGSQGPWEDRRQAAAALGLPERKVRIAHLPLGGGFGGKEDITVQIIAALGALRTGRPVKLTFSRKESIRVSVKRHAQYLRYKTGVTREGKITAVQARLLADSGAYASVGEVVIQRAVSFGAGPYTVPNADIEALAVYTNNIPGGAMRGFGNPQSTFAAEVQLNRLAQRLGLDLFEIRLRNILEEGLPTLTGDRPVTSVGARSCLLAVREALTKTRVPEPRPGWKIGIGLACSYKNVGLGSGIDDYGGASGELLPGGRLRVRVGSTDMGQGSDTAMAQIASHTLGWPYSRVMVESGDTGRDPPSLITTASRQTFITGNAVYRMALELREKIWSWLARRFAVPPEEIELQGLAFVRTSTGKALLALEELAALCESEGVRMRTEARYSAPRTWRSLKQPPGGYPPGQGRLHAAYCFGSQAVVLEAQAASGRVKVLKVIAAHDVGRAVNRAAVEGQIEGGVVMGLGYALSEEFRLERGRILTDTLARLGLWRIGQTPEIECLIVENPHDDGPYGAKGMSELPVSMAAPAVVSAIHDALGVWLTSIPATPQRILAALKAKREQSP